MTLRLPPAWLSAPREPGAWHLRGHPGGGKTHALASIFLELAQKIPAQAGYWPAGLTRSLLLRDLNAAVKGVTSHAEPPFLWWGLTLSDRTAHNADEGSAIATHADALDAQFAATERHQRMKQRLRRGARALTEGIVGAAQLTPVATTLQLLAAGGVAGQIQRLSRANGDPLGEALQRVVLGVEAACNPRTRSAIPVFIAIDNAHHLVRDEPTKKFLQRLWWASTERAWPLTLLLTSDDDDVDVDLAGAALHTIDIETATEAELRDLARQRLPGLSDADQARLIERSFACPGSLLELIGLLQLRPRAFLGRDTTQGFATDAARVLADLESTAEKSWSRRLALAAPRLARMVARLAAQGRFPSLNHDVEVAALMSDPPPAAEGGLHAALRASGVDLASSGDHAAFVSGAALCAAARLLARQPDAAIIHTAHETARAQRGDDADG